MDKPASVKRVEFINEITALINESHLPPYVISPILADLRREVDAATERQYKNEYAAYTQSLETMAQQPQSMESNTCIEQQT